LIYLDNLSTTTYTDTSAVNNQKYYYRIGAYKNGAITTYSNVVTITAETDTDETSDEIVLEADNVNDGISLSWNEYENDSISGYKLLRSTTNSNPIYDGTYYKYLASSSSIGYVDTNTDSGQKYYYRIGAYKNGEILKYSNTVTITAD
jgi:fibronectin type 3 domain-containing protein